MTTAALDSETLLESFQAAAREVFRKHCWVDTRHPVFDSFRRVPVALSAFDGHLAIPLKDLMSGEQVWLGRIEELARRCARLPLRLAQQVCRDHGRVPLAGDWTEPTLTFRETTEPRLGKILWCEARMEVGIEVTR